MPETILNVGTKLSFSDHFGMFKMRLGVRRNRYRVEPGLYKIGEPDRSSPVFVSANYKMSFDVLRKELAGMNALILVLDTRGVNVWCAAGKQTFSTCELVRMIAHSKLESFIDHRELILPQLSAPGVAGHEVQKKSGFKVVFGPVRAKDIKRFMADGKRADASMRMVTFDIRERFVLTPLELTSRIRISFYVVAVIAAISFLQGAFLKGSFGVFAYFLGLLSGAVLTPVLLPWVPGRSFSVKGAFVGFVLTSAFCIFFREQIGDVAVLTLAIFAASISSYAALAFTGSTPFTSPTGVEKEMRWAIPFQLAAAVLSAGLWIAFGSKGGHL